MVKKIGIILLLTAACSGGSGNTDQWYCYTTGDLKPHKFDGSNDRPCTKAELDKDGGIEPGERPPHQR